MKTAKLNRNTMIAANPNIDAVALKKSLKMLRELERTGLIKAHRYSLERRKMMVALQGDSFEKADSEQA